MDVLHFAHDVLWRVFILFYFLFFFFTDLSLFELISLYLYFFKSFQLIFFSCCAPRKSGSLWCGWRLLVNGAPRSIESRTLMKFDRIFSLPTLRKGVTSGISLKRRKELSAARPYFFSLFSTSVEPSADSIFRQHSNSFFLYLLKDILLLKNFYCWTPRLLLLFCLFFFFLSSPVLIWFSPRRVCVCARLPERKKFLFFG